MKGFCAEVKRNTSGLDPDHSHLAGAFLTAYTLCGDGGCPLLFCCHFPAGRNSRDSRIARGPGQRFLTGIRGGESGFKGQGLFDFDLRCAFIESHPERFDGARHFRQAFSIIIILA